MSLPPSRSTALRRIVACAVTLGVALTVSFPAVAPSAAQAGADEPHPMPIGASTAYSTKTYYPVPRYRGHTGPVSVVVTGLTPSEGNCTGEGFRVGMRTSPRSTGEVTNFPVARPNESTAFLNYAEPDSVAVPNEIEVDPKDFAGGAYYYLSAQLEADFDGCSAQWTGELSW